MLSKYSAILNKHNYPLDALWRLLINGNKQNTDKGTMVFDEARVDVILGHEVEFEGEPGYLRGMFCGLNSILADLDKPLTVQMIIALRDTVCREIESEAFNAEGPTYQADIRGEKTSFGLTMEGHPTPNWTEDGLAEICDKIQQNKSLLLVGPGPDVNINYFKEHKVSDVIVLVKQGGYFLSARGDKGYVNDEMQTIIDTYYKELKQARNNDEKILAIASCVHELEQLHPFYDANCRTFCCLILNKLLIENNLTPAICDDPNRFDGYTAGQLRQEIIAGQKAFRNQVRLPNQEIQALDDEKPVIYLKGNQNLCHLIAYQAVKSAVGDENVKALEFDAAVTLIDDALKKLNLAGKVGLTHAQLDKVMTTLTNEIKKAVYKKSPYQAFSGYDITHPSYFLEVPNQAVRIGASFSPFFSKGMSGIHFSSLVNKCFQPNALNTITIQEKLEEALGIKQDDLLKKKS